MTCPRCGERVIALRRHETSLEVSEFFVHHAEPHAADAGMTVIVGCDRHTWKRVITWTTEEYKRAVIRAAAENCDPPAPLIEERVYVVRFRQGAELRPLMRTNLIDVARACMRENVAKLRAREVLELVDQAGVAIEFVHSLEEPARPETWRVL